MIVLHGGSADDWLVLGAEDADEPAEPPKRPGRPPTHAAPYTASKHTATRLTKATALVGPPYGIACGQIDVGPPPPT